MREAFAGVAAGRGRLARGRRLRRRSPAPSRAAAARCTCTTASSPTGEEHARAAARGRARGRHPRLDRGGLRRGAARARRARARSQRGARAGALRRREGSGGGPVAVFDACHLLHAQRVREAPRELLRGAGYEPVELAGAGRCCGAAGVYAFTQPELSQQLARAASRRSARAARGSSAAATPAARCSCAARCARRSSTCAWRTPPSSWSRRPGLRPRRVRPGAGGRRRRGRRRLGAGGAAAGRRQHRWRRRRRRPRSGGAAGAAGGVDEPAERDDRHVAVGRRVDLEELALREAEHAGEDRRRERLDPRVVALHVAVVDAASTGDLILGVRQLGLQLLEVLGRAQLRVGLGDCEQPAERSGQRAFGLRDSAPGPARSSRPRAPA